MRHLLFILLFCISLYSDNSLGIISKVLVSFDSKNYIDITTTDDNLDKKFDLKIVLNKSVIKNEK